MIIGYRELKIRREKLKKITGLRKITKIILISSSEALKGHTADFLQAGNLHQPTS